MRILFTGGTGFIGNAIINALAPTPSDLVLLTRGEKRMELRGALTLKYVPWDAATPGDWMSAVDGCDAVINLVGKNVFEQRWNEKVKKGILESRTHSTRLLVDAIAKATVRPKVLVSASAVGFYGDRNEETITERSSGGSDFLADVVRQWEAEAYRAEQFGVRVATPRIGLVLEKSGGMIGKMLLPFRMFVGGPIGTGRQFLPWVHMEDVVRGILYPLENESFSGVYNLTSPHPVTMDEFSRTFGAVLHRPSWLPVPNFALQALYGEGAKVILSGQRAVPERLLEAGFQFSHTELQPALASMFA